VEDLERGRAIVPKVVREINNGEATATKLTVNSVSTGQRFGERLEFGQGRLREERTDSTLHAAPPGV
jgi:hypothetical protein